MRGRHSAGLAGANAGQTMLFGIRGVVQVDFGGQAESPVATYLDDGYIAGNSITNVGLFDLDHIEILKGPSSSFAGRGTTGGALNIVTKQAVDQDFYKSEGTLGTDRTKRVTFDVNKVISPTLDVRINGMVQKADVAGRVEHVRVDQHAVGNDQVALGAFDGIHGESCEFIIGRRPRASWRRWHLGRCPAAMKRRR